MIFCKLKTPYVMGSFEKRSFLLCSRLKSAFLQCISDCLKCDRVGDDVINELRSLNCIFKLSKLDLMNNQLFVTSRQLGGTATRVVFFVSIHFFADSTDSTLP